MTDQTSTFGDTEILTATPAASASKRASRRSAAAKLLQASALAAVLVPLGAIKADASTLQCDYQDTGSGASYSCPTGPEGGALFQFGTPDSSSGLFPYAAELRFTSLNGDFSVFITDAPRSQADLDPRLGSFAGACVPINPTNTAQPCVEFLIDAPESGPNTWTASGPRGTNATEGYELFLYWLADTDATHPDPHIIHDTSNDDPHDDTFDIDITLPFTYTTDPATCAFSPFGCDFSTEFARQVDGDPAVGGRDNDFTGHTLISPTAVPEPASLLLLGSGISGLLYRRRRK